VDTRYKIITSVDAAAIVPRLLAEDRSLKLVAGTFDPLLSSHLTRIREIVGESGWAVVILREPEKPILNARARAELASALKVVQAVVLPPENSSPGWLQGLEVADLDDTASSLEFMRLIQERHRD
jgi:hypothetical protein